MSQGFVKFLELGSRFHPAVETGKRPVVFIFSGRTAKDISGVSPILSRDEVVYLPGTSFRIDFVDFNSSPVFIGLTEL